MNIHEQLIQLVSNGSPFYIDFKKRLLRVNGKTLIDNTNINGDLNIENLNWEEFLEELQGKYKAFKYSIPSERSIKRRGYFKSLSVDELTDEQLVTGEEREIAKAELEFLVLEYILKNGTWGCNGWFWQSPDDSDLVLLKEWFSEGV